MRRLRERLLQWLVVASGFALVGAPAAWGADPEPFGHPCSQQNGVRFCPTEDSADRVPTFDDVPLDVDVTLPENGDGPWPTIVMLHGWGGDKTSFETNDEGGDGSETYHYNNNFYAKHGFAVVNYSARGWGRSCGNPGSRDDPACEHGYIRLADQRFEARDSQYLLGLLVDQGITNRTKIGVTGISYGGGQSIELAMLRNRIRTPGGDFKPWVSPKGKGMKIAAAFPRWPWSDLVASLEPNGRFLDFKKPDESESRAPLGIALESYVTGLYGIGKGNGYYCGDPPSKSPCDNDQADISKWFARVQQGEPADDEARAIADEIFRHHQGFGLPADRVAPMLSQSGWTDDLFPPRESLRMYNLLRSGGRNGDIALQFGDLGHSRGANKASTNRPLNDQGADFFRKLLLGEGSRPRPGSVTAYGQTCPASDSSSDGPFEANTWAAIHPSTVSFSSSMAEEDQTATANPLDPLGPDYDPIANQGNQSSASCKESDDSPTNDALTAVYRGEASDGFRMIGLPKVTAKISVTPDAGDDAQLDSRLWDVDPATDKQILVSRGAYRIKAGESSVTFQLSGNAWCFANGHVPKLQLLGTDRPYLRPTTGPHSAYEVHIASVDVSLPTAKGGCGT